MLDRNPLDTARQVDFPVGLWTTNGINGGPFIGRQIAIPAQIHQALHGEFRIAIGDFRPHRIRPFRQQVLTIPFNPKARPEGQSPFGHRLGRIIQDWRSRMVHFRRAPGRPGQSIIIPVAWATNRL